MSQYEIYVLILCLIVFLLLTTLSVIMLTAIVNLTIKLIRSGAEDEKIKIEHQKNTSNKNKNGNLIDLIFSILMCVILLGFFIFSLYVNISQDKYFDNIPTIKVVNTASMSKKHKDNDYLFKNNLHDQFNTFDLILTYKIPKEDELKLYDIVVYEVDEMLIVHRIVGIEEPNETHNERYFLLQGDAVESPDRFPVRYEQMKAIYRGQRIPFIGSFVSFMQSPAGWMCILLIITAYVASPIIEKILNKEKQKRLALCGVISLEENNENVFESIKNTNILVNTANIEEPKELNEKVEEIKEKNNSNEKVDVENIENQETKQDNNKNEENKEEVNSSKEEKQEDNNQEDKKEENTNENLAIENNENQQETENLVIETIEETLDTKKDDDLDEANTEDDNEDSEDLVIFDNFSKKRNSLTFRQKLHLLSDEAKARYNLIVSTLKFTNKIRVNESKKHETYKTIKLPVALITIKGKTLNVYLGINPKDYINTKYKYIDASEIKKFYRYPMRMKITSDRQAKWTCELIKKFYDDNGIDYVIKPIKNQIKGLYNDTKHNMYANFKSRTFEEKLMLASDKVKNRYHIITDHLKTLNKVRIIESKSHETFKKGHTPIVKLQIKGKTLNAYLNHDTKEFENTKYIYTDVSYIKKYEKYPMRIKVSSDRQAKWVCELIEEVINQIDKESSNEN